MGKYQFAIIGGAVGVLAALAYRYLLGPATDTTYDENYQSRLDYALSQGQIAAAEKEAELRGEFQRMRSAGANLPNLSDNKKKLNCNAKAQTRKEKPRKN